MFSHHKESPDLIHLKNEVQEVTSRVSNIEKVMNNMNSKLDFLSAQNESIISLLKRLATVEETPKPNQQGTGVSNTYASSSNVKNGQVQMVSATSTSASFQHHHDPTPPHALTKTSSSAAAAAAAAASASSIKEKDDDAESRRRKSSKADIMLKANTVYLEMAASFSNGKFETTFNTIRKTQITQSHVLCFYFTSIDDAKFILSNGFLSSTQECDGIPLSMHGPNEIVEDEEDEKAAIALAEQEVYVYEYMHLIQLIFLYVFHFLFFSFFFFSSFFFFVARLH
jgi:hypothetical protein